MKMKFIRLSSLCLLTMTVLLTMSAGIAFADGEEGEDPEPIVGWVEQDGGKYYYKDNNPVKGSIKIDGSFYYFDKSTGVMKTGWIKDGKSKFYHYSDGKRAIGAKKVGKYEYFFNKKNGNMCKGFIKVKGKKYFYRNNGRKITTPGIRKIKGKKRYFSYKGVVKNPSKIAKKIWKKSSNTNYYIRVSKKARRVYVLKGKKYNWKLIKKYRCSIGAPSTPTPVGKFKVTSKVLHFGESKGYTCWYATGFIGVQYLFHSVVCYRGTKRPSDGRLGMAISHGCIRMRLKNAKWIYDNVPVRSKVVIK